MAPAASPSHTRTMELVSRSLCPSKPMKAMTLADSAAGLRLVKTIAQRPRAGRGEVLIRVYAAGVTPTELVWYPTSHTKNGERRTGAVPGHEFSGVVTEIGAGVEGVRVGDEVYGMNDWFSDGATAEYCTAQVTDVAPKPRSLTHIEAASVPISALTAWQGLFDHARLRQGDRVLVHGGAGAVGIFAVQLAKLWGARVIATASARDRDFVAELGAGQVIDYQASRFEDSLGGVDIVFDTVGGETLKRSWSVLKPSGRMVTIAAVEEETTEERVRKAFFIVEPNRKQLSEIGGLIDGRQLRAFLGAVVPLEEAPAAYSGKTLRLGPGKLVVMLAYEGQISRRYTDAGAVA
jgi:NADPH:quinone reductase-like Zn-dependent oxidoreductase